MTLWETFLTIFLIAVLLGVSISSLYMPEKFMLWQQALYTKLLVVQLKYQAFLTGEKTELHLISGEPVGYILYLKSNSGLQKLKTGEYPYFHKLLDQNGQIVPPGEKIIFYLTSEFSSASTTAGWGSNTNSIYMIMNNRGRLRFEYR